MFFFNKIPLVPEHLETRSLLNPDIGKEIEQGKVLMWVDMFPLNDYKINNVIKPVDVSVRKPKRFQLRVTIFNTKEVTLDDMNMLTGERSSDIYVRGFMCDKDYEAQKTDIHYRSLDGEGNFNWRFIFDFDYMPAENRIVYTQKTKLGLDHIQRKVKPTVRLQCFDADQVTADDLLGQLDLNLTQIVKGASSAHLCNANMLSNPRWPKINLFKARCCRGWWPFLVGNQKILGVGFF
jgi:hypothetical protein